ALRQRDLADRLAIGVVHYHAVVLLARARADPQIAVGITAEAIRDVAPFNGDGNAWVGKLGPVVDEIVAADHPRHYAIVGEIDFALVGRKAKPIRPQITGNHGGAPGLGIEPVDVGRQLRLLDPALVGIEVGGRRIGEPDRVVGLNPDVVWRIERLAIELVDQHRDAAVVFGARQPPRIVLASDEPALAVTRESVRVA